MKLHKPKIYNPFDQDTQTEQYLRCLLGNMVRYYLDTSDTSIIFTINGARYLEYAKETKVLWYVPSLEKMVKDPYLLDVIMNVLNVEILTVKRSHRAEPHRYPNLVPYVN